MNSYLLNFRNTFITINPLLSPPGAYLFQAHLRGGDLLETGGLFERGGLFNVETTMVSVLHKELVYKVESSSTSSFRSCSRGSESNPIFQLVTSKPSRISLHKVLQSWLINTTSIIY